ncbi:MAG: hypothetical protein WBA54_10515 [Acidaminobacteraceae bacterium]
MYKRFVKNMKHFLRLNYPTNGVTNYRYELVKSMDSLTDVNEFLKLKKNEPHKYNEISNVIWEIKRNIYIYPSFKVLSWELWGYNFDGEKHECKDEEKLREQLKMIDLLLSTKYWN